MFDRFMDNLAKISFFVGIVVAVVVAGLFILMPHNILGYYIGQEYGSVPTYCVYADMAWGPDFTSYCSADIQQTGLVYTNLMRSMRFASSPTPQLPPGIEIPAPLL